MSNKAMVFYLSVCLVLGAYSMWAVMAINGVRPSELGLAYQCGLYAGKFKGEELSWCKKDREILEGIELR